MESTVPKHGSVAQPLVLEQQKSLAEREAEYADARSVAMCVTRLDIVIVI